MKIIKINRYRIAKGALAEAVSVLRVGGVVAFPTETAYGLAADPLNQKAVRRIFRMKGRRPEKRLPFVAGGMRQVRQGLEVGRLAGQLAERHWPGPLTIILSTRPEGSLSTWPDAAVRIPSSVWAKALPMVLGRPVTATSANFSGEPNCYSGKEVIQAFKFKKNAPDLVLDGGKLPPRLPSTIVRIDGRNLSVLRQGSVRVDRELL